MHLLSEEEKELIGQYSIEEIDEKNLFTFNVTLCDNEVDRDGERFSIKSLYQLGELFLGKSGIFDHNPKASAQSARIYQTEVIEEKDKKTLSGETYYKLTAKAYMVKHQDNEGLISEIMGGIKKEVSVGCRMGKKICSICGTDILENSCGHEKGKEVHHILEEALDAYEWSFVVVPAQKAAGVTKKYTGLEQEDGQKMNLQIEKLEKEAAFGRMYRENLLRDFMVHALKCCPEISGKAIRSIGEKLLPEELMLLKKAMGSEKVKSQLFTPEETEKSADVYHLS